jgi:(1->4)-alpha-D-glucan 1-alpha-D-glucosylmutase
MPGIPDVYQGTEFETLTLVDPDNRRPVDLDARHAALARLDAGSSPKDLDEEKLLVTAAALRLRRAHPEWFGPEGSYEPLATPDHVLGFSRAGRVITLATRLAVTLERAGGFGDATVSLPPGAWTEVLTGRQLTGDVRCTELFAELPVALLVAAG